MKKEAGITKGKFSIILIAILIITSVLVVYAYNVNYNYGTAQGAIAGHSADEVVVRATNGSLNTVQNLLLDMGSIISGIKNNITTVNTTLNTKINGVSTSITNNITAVNTSLNTINTTLTNRINVVNSTLSDRITTVSSQFNSLNDGVRVYINPTYILFGNRGPSSFTTYNLASYVPVGAKSVILIVHGEIHPGSSGPYQCSLQMRQASGFPQYTLLTVGGWDAVYSSAQSTVPINGDRTIQMYSGTDGGFAATNGCDLIANGATVFNVQVAGYVM